MNEKLISKYNEEINDKLDLIKSFVSDQTKEIEDLQSKMLKELNK